MNLHTLKNSHGAKKSRMRVGRGSCDRLRHLPATAPDHPFRSTRCTFRSYWRSQASLLRGGAPCLISSIGWTPWRPSTLRQRRRNRKRETLRTSRVAPRLARPSLVPPGKPFRRHAMAMEGRGRRAGLGHRTGRTAQGSGRNTEGVNRGAQRDHERAHHRQRR